MPAPTELQAIRSMLKRKDLTPLVHDLLVVQRADLVKRQGRYARWLERRERVLEARQDAAHQRGAELYQSVQPYARVA